MTLPDKVPAVADGKLEIRLLGLLAKIYRDAAVVAVPDPSLPSGLRLPYGYRPKTPRHLGLALTELDRFIRGNGYLFNGRLDEPLHSDMLSGTHGISALLTSARVAESMAYSLRAELAVARRRLAPRRRSS